MTQNTMQLFDFENPVNPGRQDELDVLKAGALWLMILCHSIMILKNDWSSTSIYEWIFYYASSAVGAQSFMMCMGVGMVYSRSQSARQLFRRGVTLLTLGYTLNVFRDFLPMLISGVHPYLDGELTLVTSLFEMDILQFAGMTFMYFGLIKHWKISDFSMLLITLFLAAAGGFLNHSFLEKPTVASFLLGLFIFTNDLCSFPFLSWIIYPVAGYFLGKLLLHCLDKQRMYRAMLWLGTALVSGFIAGCLRLDIGFNAILGDKDFYGQNPIISYGLLSMAILWPAVAYFFSRCFNKQWMMALARHWSSSMTMIYFISWIIFGFLSAALDVLGYRAYVPQSAWLYLLTSVVVFSISDAVGIGYRNYKAVGGNK